MLARLALPLPADLQAGAVAATAAGPLQLFDSLGGLELAWRDLETRAIVSPYQRFDLVAAWARHAAADAGVEVRPALLRDAAGRPVAILPFGIRRLGPARMAVYLGGSQINANLPLIAEGAVVDVGALLDAYAVATGVDGFVLNRQPLAWAELPHPLAVLPHRPAPHELMQTRFGGPFQDFFQAQLSRPTRHKLRRRQTLIAEAGGRMREAATAADVDRVLDAFFVQKSARLAAMGAADPFARAGVKAFLRQAAVAGLGAEEGFRLYWLEAEGLVLATAGGVRHGSTFSWMINSYDAGHALARQSPGEVLLAWMLGEQAGSGTALFEFGVGDERFKRTWSNGTTAMIDTLRPATMLGRVVLAAVSLRLAAEREVRARPALFQAFRTMRRRLAGQG